MLQILKNIFKRAGTNNYGDLVKQGAIILDVRSEGEYTSGHIKRSINIPVHQLGDYLVKLKDKHRAIICCCASGMRSGTAKKILESRGYTNVFNGGGWRQLQHKIENS